MARMLMVFTVIMTVVSVVSIWWSVSSSAADRPCSTEKIRVTHSPPVNATNSSTNLPVSPTGGHPSDSVTEEGPPPPTTTTSASARPVKPQKFDVDSVLDTSEANYTRIYRSKAIRIEKTTISSSNATTSSASPSSSPQRCTLIQSAVDWTFNSIIYLALVNASDVTSFGYMADFGVQISVVLIDGSGGGGGGGGGTSLELYHSFASRHGATYWRWTPAALGLRAKDTFVRSREIRACFRFDNQWLGSSLISDFSVYLANVTSIEYAQPVPTDLPNDDNRTHHLAIVAPAKGVIGDDHIPVWLNYLQPFLQRYLPEHYTFELIVAKQIDDTPFNRAGVLNMGFLAASPHVDYFVFMDLDFLPFPSTSFEFLPKIRYRGRHMAYVTCNYQKPVQCMADKQFSEDYFAAVIMLSRSMVVDINGWSNRFWGWGGEDNELRERVVRYLNTQSVFWREEDRFWHIDGVGANKHLHANYKNNYKLWEDMRDGKLNPFDDGLTTIWRKKAIVRLDNNFTFPNAKIVLVSYDNDIAN